MQHKSYKGYRWLTLRDATLYVAILATVIAVFCAMSALDKQEAAKLAEKEVIQQIEVKPVMSVQIEEKPVSDPEPEVIPEPQPEAELISLGEFRITHYCPCSKCCGKWADGYTATGTEATEGRTIAVDPDVIPYGTEVLICYEDGTEHTYISEDCGGSIKGNRIDIFMNSHEAALIEGVKIASVYLVNN